jgi:hypothetical protein
MHVGMALVTLVVHAMPQAPQLSGSLVVSLQLPLQAMVLPGHVAAQAYVDPVGAQ